MLPLQIGQQVHHFLPREGGTYLVSLLEEHRRQLNLSPARNAELDRLLENLAETRLGPQHVICNVIENTYGRPEAARYVLALVEGRAT